MENGKTKQEYEVNKDYDHDITIMMYHQYKAGIVDGETWVMYLVRTLQHYMEWLIKKDSRYIETGCEKEDLMQSGCVAILKKAKDYNPEKSRPSTFFSSDIRGAMRDCCVSSSTMTEHYAKLSRKLEASLKEAGFVKGTDDPTLTLDTMAVLAGLSIEVIQNILSYKKLKICAITETDKSRDMTPEDAILHKERASILEEELSQCTELEKFLLLNAADTKPLKMLTIVKMLHDPSFHSRFPELNGKSKESITQAYLERTLNKVISRMQKNLRPKLSYDEKQSNMIMLSDEDMEELEFTNQQASVTELLEQMEDGLAEEDANDPFDIFSEYKKSHNLK